MPKTQGKISKNHKFPANRLSSKAGKTSQKKPRLNNKKMSFASPNTHTKKKQFLNKNNYVQTKFQERYTYTMLLRHDVRMLVVGRWLVSGFRIDLPDELPVDVDEDVDPHTFVGLQQPRLLSVNRVLGYVAVVELDGQHCDPVAFVAW